MTRKLDNQSSRHQRSSVSFRDQMTNRRRSLFDESFGATKRQQFTEYGDDLNIFHKSFNEFHM